MGDLNTQTIRPNIPLRQLWTADEVKTVKKFVRDLRVQTWNLPQTEVDYENAVIYIPAPSDTIPALFVAVADAVEGDDTLPYIDGPEQDEDREYIELRRINSDGTYALTDRFDNPIDSQIYQVMPEVDAPAES